MTTDEKIKWLGLNCKGGFFIFINDHFSSYMTAKESLQLNPEDMEDIPKDVLEKMIEMDTIIRVQGYPDTPIGFYFCLHYDLDAAVDEVYQIISKKKE